MNISLLNLICTLENEYSMNRSLFGQNECHGHECDENEKLATNTNVLCSFPNTSVFVVVSNFVGVCSIELNWIVFRAHGICMKSAFDSQFNAKVKHN